MNQEAFVGREAEMGQLQAAFEGASSGDGSLFMLVGEPGIGKTALCEQLAGYVEASGHKTLIGHCYEEGSLSLPYLAFVEAMRSYVLERDVEELKEELGTDAGDLARIVPEIRDRLGVEPTPPSDPEQDRYRLLQAASTFLRNASDVQPLLVVLEDLHDADSGTLDMLNHVARNLSDSQLLVVGTYRDVDVDRAHPLSGALAELRRASAFGRISLRGLTVDEVRQMISGVADQRVSEGLAEAVHGQTEGNPLFVQEVLRYLVEEGLVARDQGRWRSTGETPLGSGIPEGLRDVIGKRLTRLSEECNRVLGIAAVIGRDFSLQVLQEVTDLPERELFAGLEEAQRASIIEERSSVGTGVAFRFAHALFRRTLYEETFAPRRVRLHQQVGRALEEVYAERPQEHATEMADHFAQSTERGDLEKALKYGEMGAERSTAVYAYGEAARLLEQALQVQEVLAPSTRSGEALGTKAKRCDLLLSLGEVLMPAGEPRRAYDTVAPDAFVLAEALEDPGRASRACQVALDAIRFYGVATSVSTPTYRRWAERADDYAAPGTIARVQADVALSVLRLNEGLVAEAWSLLQRGLALARHLDDPELILLCVGDGILGRASWLPEHGEELTRLAQEFSEPYGGQASANSQGRTLHFSYQYLYAFGDRDRAGAAWEHFEELAERTKDPFLHVLWLIDQVDFKLRAGLLEEAVEATDRLVVGAEDMGMPVMGLQFAFTVGLWPLLYLGRAEEALAALHRVSQLAGREEGPPPSGYPLYLHCLQILCLGHAGRITEAKATFRNVMEMLDNPIATKQAPTQIIFALLEAAVLLEEREAANILAGPHAGTAAGVAYLFWSGRHLGGAARLSGERQKALDYYFEALEVSSKMRVRPEIAHIRLEIADLLLSPSTRATPEERDEAMEHLEFAIAGFEDMKMQPSLEKALQVQGRLSGVKPSYPGGLTEREVEVLRLIAAGSSNQEIANQLFLSVRTVERHITNIYRKIDARGRADAVAYALKHDMGQSA